MSHFLSVDVEAGLQSLLTATLPQINIGSIGDKDINDEGNLIFETPCVRTRHGGTLFGEPADNQALTYSHCEHVYELWCAAENLSSKEAQRNDTETLLGQVVTQITGARITLADGSKSEPVRVIDVQDFPQDIVGLVYILRIVIPGIAQFDGPNANPN